MDDTNPPMCLPNGQVFSRNYIREKAYKNSKSVKHPLDDTEKEIEENETAGRTMLAEWTELGQGTVCMAKTCMV